MRACIDANQVPTTTKVSSDNVSSTTDPSARPAHLEIWGPEDRRRVVGRTASETPSRTAVAATPETALKTQCVEADLRLSLKGATKPYKLLTAYPRMGYILVADLGVARSARKEKPWEINHASFEGH